jgi:glutamate dehydrogenase/leucine dehydrogenase
VLGVGSVGAAVARLAPRFGHAVAAIGDPEGALVGEGIDDAESAFGRVEHARNGIGTSSSATRCRCRSRCR